MSENSAAARNFVGLRPNLTQLPGLRSLTEISMGGSLVYQWNIEPLRNRPTNQMSRLNDAKPHCFPHRRGRIAVPGRLCRLRRCSRATDRRAPALSSDIGRSHRGRRHLFLLDQQRRRGSAVCPCQSRRWSVIRSPPRPSSRSAAANTWRSCAMPARMACLMWPPCGASSPERIKASPSPAMSGIIP